MYSNDGPMRKKDEASELRKNKLVSRLNTRDLDICHIFTFRLYQQKTVANTPNTWKFKAHSAIYDHPVKL